MNDTNRTMQVQVPDIGDFEEVEVIEILVAEGDTIHAEQSLITVESDKASMEIPSPAAGVVQRLLVRLGDRISEGSAIIELQTGSADDAAAAPPARAGDAGRAAVQSAPGEAAPHTPTPGGQSASAPAAPPAAAGAAVAADTADTADTADLSCALLVLGGGPGGYAAAFRGADLGLDTILVERYPTLGGVCLNVGCIPSKALLHVASVIDQAQALEDLGVEFGPPRIDLDALRRHKEAVVDKLTAGVAGMAKARKVRVVQGTGRFVDAHRLEVSAAGGDGAAAGPRVIRFEQAIVAAGSRAIRLPFLPDDPRIVDSTGALALPFVPKRMLVIGGGIIGLEMATVYSTLGARVDVVEMLDTLMPGADRKAVQVWQRFNARRFERVMLRTKTVGARAAEEGIVVTFEGADAPDDPQTYDLVLCAVGRAPNGDAIGAAAAGIEVGERGFVRIVDRQMRTSVPHIFAIGDIAGAPMLAHKATHEGHVAAEAAAGRKSFFDARVIPSVAYTDPEIAWAGLTQEEAAAAGVTVTAANFPWAASGRALANTRAEGFTKLLFDEESGRLVGGTIVGTHAGELIGEIALAIEMGCDATDIGRTIHPHPTLCETVGLAAEVEEGSCTDLPPPRNR